MGCTDWKVVETGKGREKKTQNSSNKSGNSTFCHFFFFSCESFEFDNFGSEEA